MDRSWPRIALWAAVLLAVAWILGRFQTLVILGVIVGVLTFPVYPLVDWLERRVGLSRSAAAALTLLALLILLGLGLVIVIPWITGQARVLIAIAPRGVEAVREFINGWQVRVADPTFPDVLRTGWERAGEAVISVANTAVSRAVNLTVGIFSQLYLILLLPFMLYFVLLDYPQTRASVLGLVPAPTRVRLEGLLSALTTTLRWGLWAQLVVSTIVGALTAIGLWMAEVPGPLAIGVFAAVAEAIPYIGGFATYGVVLLAAAPQGGSVWAWGLLVVTIVKLLSNVLVPLILGRMTRTHPLALIVALLALNQLFGLLGMFFAVPVVVIVREVLAWWWPGAPPAAAPVPPAAAGSPATGGEA